MTATMITDPNRLIAYQRVSHIPEGRKYTYVDEPYCLEFYMAPFPKGFWNPTPMPELEVSGFLLKNGRILIPLKP